MRWFIRWLIHRVVHKVVKDCDNYLCPGVRPRVRFRGLEPNLTPDPT